jgi:hypothetical protein
MNEQKMEDNKTMERQLFRRCYSQSHLESHFSVGEFQAIETSKECQPFRNIKHNYS